MMLIETKSLTHVMGVSCFRHWEVGNQRAREPNTHTRHWRAIDNSDKLLKRHHTLNGERPLNPHSLYPITSRFPIPPHFNSSCNGH